MGITSITTTRGLGEGAVEKKGQVRGAHNVELEGQVQIPNAGVMKPEKEISSFLRGEVQKL